ncbi:hypothetical protein AAG906_026770 [Vitis piasezkii]
MVHFFTITVFFCLPILLTIDDVFGSSRPPSSMSFVPSAIMVKSGVASTSGRSQRGGSKSSKFEFHVRCYIPDSISIQLSDKKVSSTDGLPYNMGPDKLFKPTQSLEIPSKETWGHLVEWVEKSFFTRLNKLYKIDQAKWNHTVLLTENYLKVVLAHPKSSVIPVFPRLAPPTLVTANKQKVRGKKGSSSKLVATLPTASILSSPSILKSDDVESISFHCLGETITVSNDDSTPSITSSSYLSFDVSYERTLLSYGKNSNGRIYRPLAELHGLHGTSDETIEAIMCRKDYTVMQMTEVIVARVHNLMRYIPFDDEDKVVLGDEVVQRDGLAIREGFATIHNEVHDIP